jgi:hypothetical protein
MDDICRDDRLPPISVPVLREEALGVGAIKSKYIYLRMQPGYTRRDPFPSFPSPRWSLGVQRPTVRGVPLVDCSNELVARWLGLRMIQSSSGR